MSIAGVKWFHQPLLVALHQEQQCFAMLAYPPGVHNEACSVSFQQQYCLPALQVCMQHDNAMSSMFCRPQLIALNNSSQ
jgi:hypothetical protein